MGTEFLPGAEPLFLEGSSNQGCLLLHGAGGGSAWDLKEFAYFLHKKAKMAIRLPTLKGFGSKSEDLRDVVYQDWHQQAEDQVAVLQAGYDDVFVVGHSFGGIIALLLSANHPRIAGLTLWSTPFEIKSRLFKLLPILVKIPGTKRLFSFHVKTPAPVHLKGLGWIGYEKVPASLGLVILEGFSRLKKTIHKVTCPTLIVQGENDELIQEKSAERIFHGISSHRKDVCILNGARHPFMFDPNIKKLLFRKTIDFLMAH
ncbi:MAG: alpha/beta hydrolase [Candidatus Heimdallarchaeota archaeon]